MVNTIPHKFKSKLDSLLEPKASTIYASAPGRINLIGEHTDYNRGLVLPAAIDKRMYISCFLNGTNKVRATAIDKNQTLTIDLEKLVKSKHLWADFLIGILIEFKNSGVKLKGFDCAFTSEVPIGAGMSSSAALECAFLVAIQGLYKTSIDNWELVKMSQRSNHNFLGIKGGILDQFTSLFGKENHLMFLDCDTLEYNYVQIPASEYEWLLINTCVKHNHISSGYNDRVRECKTGLENIQSVFPEIKHLSQVTDLDELKTVGFSSEIIKKRVYYVVSENNRVKSFIHQLNEGDYGKMGQLLYASHNGLSKNYEVSCVELDFIVDLLKDNPQVLGSRMMGGGFGGCTINLIHKDALEQVKTELKADYQKTFNIEPEFYEVKISGGAELFRV